LHLGLSIFSQPLEDDGSKLSSLVVLSQLKYGFNSIDLSFSGVEPLKIMLKLFHFLNY